jgi:hypothetical protein
VRLDLGGSNAICCRCGLAGSCLIILRRCSPGACGMGVVLVLAFALAFVFALVLVSPFPVRDHPSCRGSVRPGPGQDAGTRAALATIVPLARSSARPIVSLRPGGEWGSTAGRPFDVQQTGRPTVSGLSPRRTRSFQKSIRADRGRARRPDIRGGGEAAGSVRVGLAASGLLRLLCRLQRPSNYPTQALQQLGRWSPAIADRSRASPRPEPFHARPPACGTVQPPPHSAAPLAIEPAAGASSFTGRATTAGCWAAGRGLRGLGAAVLRSRGGAALPRSDVRWWAAGGSGRWCCRRETKLDGPGRTGGRVYN